MLGHHAIGEEAIGALPAAGGAAPPTEYVYPAANAVNLQFGDAYERPTGTAADLAWPASGGEQPPVDSVEGDAAGTLSLTGAAVGAHGVAGTATGSLGLTGAATGEYESPVIQGTAAGTVTLTGSASASHGVSGAAAGPLELVVDATGAHGVAGVAAGVLAFAGGAEGAHGVAGVAAGAFDITGSATGIHERYELRGEVRLSGILIDRRVRAYLRATGALVGEVDTVAGRFAIPVGFAPAEHYVVPIDMSDDASDWTPPTANRVMAVLAFD